MTEEKLFAYYESTFRVIYADLVATIGSKPLEISFEIEAMVTHLSVAKNHADKKIIDQNISRAIGHLQRATLDAGKMLWLELRKRCQLIIDDDFVRSYCTLVPESQLMAQYHKAESLALVARRLEIKNVGIDPEMSASKYFEAANEFRNLLDAVDWTRVKSSKKFKFIHKLKEYFVGFLIGVVSSTVVALLSWKYLPPPVESVPVHTTSTPAKK